MKKKSPSDMALTALTVEAEHRRKAMGLIRYNYGDLMADTTQEERQRIIENYKKGGRLRSYETAERFVEADDEEALRTFRKNAESGRKTWMPMGRKKCGIGQRRSNRRQGRSAIDPGCRSRKGGIYKMFRFKKSVPVEYDTQGYIYFTSRLHRTLPADEQQRILNLCMEAGGEYYQALYEFVTSDAGATAVCRKHFLSQSTLERVVRKYYILFAESL